MPFHEIGLPRLPFDRLDQGVRQFLLRIGDDAFETPAILEDDGAVGLDVVLPGLDRFLVDVDVAYRDLRAHILVLHEPGTEPVEVVIPPEHGDRHRAVESVEDPDRLLGQCELPSRGQVPASVLPGGDVVDGDQNAQDSQGTGRRQRAVSRVAVLEQA